MIRKLVFILVLFISLPAFAEDNQTPIAASQEGCVPPDGGICLTKEQRDAIKQGILELDEIHNSQAIITTDDSITIIQDWNGRVYVNGGDKNPIRLKLKIGKTIERDLSMVLPTQVHYRPEPPDPMFRLRIRAQVGILIPQMIQTFDGDKRRFWDSGLGWDFFHLDDFNVALYTGVNSLGGGIGYDLTRNFGLYGGYAFVYSGLQSSIITTIYFSFN